MDRSASTDSAEPTLRRRLAAAWRSGWGRLARLVLAILPLAYLAHRIDVGTVLRGIRAVGLPLLAQGLLIQLANSALVSLRWRLLLDGYGAPRARVPSVAYLLRTNLVANYAALLPVPLADDGIRGLRTMHVFPDSRVTPYLVLLAERTVGLTGLLLLAVIAFAIRGHHLPPTMTRIFTIGLGAATVLALVVIVAPLVLEARPRWRERLARIPFARGIVAFPAPTRLRGLVLPLVLSVIGHFLSAALIWWIMSQLDPRVTLSMCTQLQPLVLIVMAVPITPAGLGQRELAFAAVYGLAGISAATAVSTSLLSLALALAQALIGGLVFAGEKATGASIPPSVVE